MADRSKKTRILFLCTGNIARSQMAEAIARLDHPEVLDPVSAGSRAGSSVHPLAIRAMEELGADMSRARPKSAEQFLNDPFDLVVTVCDSAAADCPVWPNARRIEHWPIEDPSFGADDPRTRFDRFVERRDELRRRIADLVQRLQNEHSERHQGTPAGERLRR